jgi:putative redox protein
VNSYNPVVAKAPTVVDLTWTGDLVLSGTSGNASMTLDSAGVAGPSPVQALAFALAGCMTMDVGYILTKGQQPFRALRSHLVADRAPEDPHRIVRMHLQVSVDGDVPADAVARAIALSYEKYCSVWHSMRQDIVFTTSHDVQP